MIDGRKIREKLCELWKKVLLTLGGFFLMVFLGALLLILAYALPIEKINLHVRESGAYMQPEGAYWRMIPNSPFTNLDNSTDTTMLLIAAYDSGENLIQKAANNYYITLKDVTKPESCMLLESAEEIGYYLHQYGRYWHGYLVVLKPLLLFLDISEIRELNMLLVIGAIVTVSLLMYRRGKLRYVFPYLLAVCFMNPGTIANSLQNSTIFHTASIAMIVLLLFYDKEIFHKHLWLFFMLLGMVTSYVDFLTYPIVSLGFPLICVLILNTGNNATGTRQIGKNFWQMLLNSGMWGFGYVGMWGSKWVLSSWVTGNHYFADALNNIEIRSSSVAFGEEFSLIDLYTKLGYYLSISRIWTITLIFVFLCAVALCFCKKRWNEWSLSVIFLIIAFYPVMWGIFAKNHTYIHDLFTHRGWGLTIWGLSSSILPLIGSCDYFHRMKKK